MHSMPLKLKPGQDLRLSLEQLSKQEGVSGFVLGVVGNLSRAAFQCPGRSEPTVLEGNLEIITLNGTLSPEGVHLHLSLSDGACQVWGGHLEPGTLILKGADILVGFLDKTTSEIESSQKTILNNIRRVEIAVTPHCPWSARAIRILRSLDIPFIVTTVDSDESFKAMFKRSEMKTFPQVFIDGKIIGGYDQLAELKSLGKLEELR